ncbi:MAG: hypothetical protein KAG61_09210 [Bacteriovoracaceae bacterium]|nr:hypothetical protein [Bacteriovoracaceae bacterium]
MGLVQKNNSSRRYLRYKAAANSLCGIYFGEMVEEYSPDLVGIVCNEGHKGCSVATTNSENVVKGRKVIVQVAQFSPVEATIRWVVKLDEDLCKLGIEYSIDHIK